MNTYILEETRLLNTPNSSFRMEVFKNEAGNYRILTYILVSHQTEIGPQPLRYWATLDYNVAETADLERTLKEIEAKCASEAMPDFLTETTPA